MKPFRILIKAGLLLYGFNAVKSSEGDAGPPPLKMNYIVAVKELASETSEVNDPISTGTLVHATSAVLSLEKTVENGIEELTKTVIKILQNLIQQNTKNSPLYSRLVEVLWTSNPLTVFVKLKSQLSVKSNLLKIKILYLPLNIYSICQWFCGKLKIAKNL